MALFVFLYAGMMRSQPPQFKIFNYIDTYAPEAVEQMLSYRIPASVILAQAIFESGSGHSELARRSNNHFGIKCHQWQGDTVLKTDDSANECFRKYNSIRESYTDHSEFLISRQRYAPLFKLAITDYKGWCRGLKEAGYATYPRYAEELIKIIEEHHLYEFDRLPAIIPPGITVTEPEIRPTVFRPTSLSLSEFLRNDLLWLDEQDVVIRSLDLIVEPEETTLLASDK